MKNTGSALEFSNDSNRFEMARQKSFGNGKNGNFSTFDWENKMIFQLSFEESLKVMFMFAQNFFRFTPGQKLTFPHIQSTSPKYINVTTADYKGDQQYHIEVQEAKDKDAKRVFIALTHTEMFGFFIFCVLSVVKQFLENFEWQSKNVKGIPGFEKLSLPNGMRRGEIIRLKDINTKQYNKFRLVEIVVDIESRETGYVFEQIIPQ